MKTRIITSIVAICVLLPCLFFSDTPLLPCAIAFCSLLAVFEMLGCVGLKKSVAASLPLYLFAAGFPFVVRYLPEYLTRLTFAAAFLTVLYFFGLLIFSHGKYDLQTLCVLFTSIFYILVGFNAILYIRDWEIGGEYAYLITFIGAWVTDIFAYFCGMFLGRGGKHKLVPDVSPKKTVEGSVGGIVFCILAMLLFGFIVGKIEPSFQINYLILAACGLVVSVVSQIGDLSMSVIKRHYGIKDYGKIFPGHGGVLDRFDSVIAVSVILLIFTSFFNFFEVI